MEDLWRDLSQVVWADRPLDDVLGEVTGIAARTIPGAESTSITLVRGDRAFTAAHTGEMALAADEMQYERGHGPCMDAGRAGVVIRIDDMRAEQRYPDYTARVVGVGVRSSLSMPLPYQGSTIGALNIYSSQHAAFAAPESEEVATAVAEAVAVAVANADADDPPAAPPLHLRPALEARAGIRQA